MSILTRAFQKDINSCPFEQVHARVYQKDINKFKSFMFLSLSVRMQILSVQCFSMPE